ncbi:MAG: adenosylmethionine--8-amino-7-oxononanoate transaminase [Bacteroidota bacterium]|nr:adenosylmethionine--8-amino-7-oxononanoate transaminase [Bacteroidota bacterium]
MSLAERDQRVIWHPFTPQKNMTPPVPITSAAGTLLYAEDGSTYIDAISSWWVNLHGHAHPYIAEKIYHQALQLEQVIFAGFTHEPAVSLAERLLPLLPGNMSRIFYSDNGSTSTEVALKMSIQYWWNRGETNRKKILAFRNSYHGDTFGAMSVSDRSVFTLAFHDLLFEVIFIDTPTPENIDATIQLLQEQGEQIAAFIYEPLVQGAGGIKMYDAALMGRLLAATQRSRIICIADEVMTGFGRTGKLFASEYLIEQPDIICLSKGLTGGTMALGVTACKQHIYEAFVNDDTYKTFFHGHSFTANPIACTAALASLDLLEKEGCRQKIDWICRSNQTFAGTLAADHPVKDVRVCGTILAFEINQGKDGYLNSISSFVTQQAMQKGVYLRPLGNTVYLMPPYCITEEELTQVYRVIKDILEPLSR